MAKLNCPRCPCKMYFDPVLNKSYCCNCGYNKPTEEEIRLAKWPN